MVLSAFPSNIGPFPDPFHSDVTALNTKDLQVPPLNLSDYTSILDVYGLRQPVDAFFKNRSIPFLLELKSKLLLRKDAYNLPLMNALVLYIGVQGIHLAQGAQFDGLSIMPSAAMDIFYQLIIDLDLPGRYHLINAMANQLRYPCSYTHYFSRVILVLFSESNQEIIKEQIAMHVYWLWINVTRVLLERLTAIRPHPWGLLTTFIELLSGERYRFWEHPFVRCTPEILDKFRSVATSMNIKVQ
jgi:CCR4-NOT transcription complex subunit 1